MPPCVDAALFLLLIALHALLPAITNAALQDGFYSSNTNCTVDVEATVASVVQQYVYADRGVGAGLIRLHFHDCFVRGCDGSVLIDPSPANPNPEKTSPANGGLRGLDVIQEAKRQLESLCPGTVSCADILAFAARDATRILSSWTISYRIPSGRRDGLASSASDATQNLSPPDGTTKRIVGDRAMDPGRWEVKSGDAMGKIGALDVLTGDQGEVRRFCHVTNSS
ncbi:hypothetical protein PR202_gb20578 [Eleusine coracana subsp. coracana]|uniref:Plant heme peroxidase family profile domain-containing protein n=1 Tax=Eleusine coracana subsp. coracana TaxID=191504 RepID=A0AAV5FB81_ELECO|nr:hypothetical protein PR202_gb20578 [Eleusine coracana subsp. coracana]